MRIKDSFEIEPMPVPSLQVSAVGLDAFVKARRGLTAHWGLYSVLGAHEWVYFNDRIPLSHYSELMKRFNPVHFNAEEWADLILESDMRFFVITSKHHDGFCLWDSDLTDFKVTHSAFGRDVIGELAPALRDRGIGLHFYYSLIDWTHPNYRTSWDSYVAYYQAQLRELCTRYGDIAGIILDGYWPRQEFEGDEIEYHSARGPWQLATTYRIIHELQPNAVIANNSHIPPLPGEDYQIWELDLPGENTIGFNTVERGAAPVASWFNLNVGWSYQPRAHKPMTLASLLSTHDAVEASGAVFMLNVGPRPYGDIHPTDQQILREFGAALRSRG